MRIVRVIAAGVLWTALAAPGGCGGEDAGGDRDEGPAADGPLAVRAEHLLVPPATGPVTHVLVWNGRDKPFTGTLRMTFPGGWKMNRTAHRLDLAPGASARVAFAIERGANAASNRYPVRIEVDGAPEAAREQSVVCAGAPYFKPAVDGRLDEWADAIPVTFETEQRKTTINTYWSKRRFSLLVSVEEDALVPMPAAGGERPFDAVQVALAAAEAATPTDPAGEARRHEFLITARGADRRGTCFTLMQPGMKVAAGQTARPLGGRETPGAEVAVVRDGGWTHYECTIPFDAIRTVRPEAGREFRFSVLVHDPDGVGLRDWGQAAGLWPWQRTRLAWSTWPGANRPPDPPFDGKIEWGFCSSKN